MITKILKLQSLGNLTYCEAETDDGLIFNVGIPFHCDDENEAIIFLENNYKTSKEQVELDCGPDDEYLANEYKYKRQPEYPSIGDQLDALFHAGVFPEEMAAQIQAVKDKYPKA